MSEHDNGKPVVAVEVREVYGVRVAYPANDKAKVVAAIANAKTLTGRVRELARDLGFNVVEIYGRSLAGVA